MPRRKRSGRWVYAGRMRHGVTVPASGRSVVRAPEGMRVGGGEGDPGGRACPGGAVYCSLRIVHGMLARCVFAGAVAAVLVFVALGEGMARDAASGRALRQRGERVTVRVSGHEPHRPTCTLLLTGTLASGREFTARQIHSNGCEVAPAVGTAQALVVLPDDPTQSQYPDILAARDAEGFLPNDVQVRWGATVSTGLFAALLSGLVQWAQRRKGRGTRQG